MPKHKLGIAPDDPLMHNVAALDCLIWADSWLAAHAPDELAAVVHEDVSGVKERIKYSLRAARGQIPPLDEPLPYPVPDDIPITRIIDTIHWAEKPDAPPLQLADLCAFTFCRVMKEPNWQPTDKATDQVISDVWNIIGPLITWYGPEEEAIALGLSEVRE